MMRVASLFGTRSNIMGTAAEMDDLDAQIAALQTLKAAKLAKEEASRKIEEKKAKDILIGSTPTKSEYPCVRGITAASSDRYRHGHT